MPLLRGGRSSIYYRAVDSSGKIRTVHALFLQYCAGALFGEEGTGLAIFGELFLYACSSTLSNRIYASSAQRSIGMIINDGIVYLVHSEPSHLFPADWLS